MIRKSPRSSCLRRRRRTSKLRSCKRALSLKEKGPTRKRRLVKTASMKRRKMDTEKKTTMRKVDTSGAKKVTTGTGTTRRTRRHTNVEIPCQTLLTLLFSLTGRQSKKLLLRLAKRT
jgi:hypothetical protein